jgi:hypothetical protein
VADSFTFEADKINSIYALVDLLSVEDPTSEFLDPNAQQLFVVLLDLASARLVAWQIFVVGFVVARVVEVVIRPVFRRSSRSLLFCSWHVFLIPLFRDLSQPR